MKNVFKFVFTLRHLKLNSFVARSPVCFYQRSSEIGQYLIPYNLNIFINIAAKNRQAAWHLFGLNVAVECWHSRFAFRRSWVHISAGRQTILTEASRGIRAHKVVRGFPQSLEANLRNRSRPLLSTFFTEHHSNSILSLTL